MSDHFSKTGITSMLVGGKVTRIKPHAEGPIQCVGCSPLYRSVSFSIEGDGRDFRVNLKAEDAARLLHHLLRVQRTHPECLAVKGVVYNADNGNAGFWCVRWPNGDVVRRNFETEADAQKWADETDLAMCREYRYASSIKWGPDYDSSMHMKVFLARDDEDARTGAIQHGAQLPAMLATFRGGRWAVIE